MRGIFIGCFWCGRDEKNSIHKSFIRFEKYLKENCGWIFVKKTGCTYDFCSTECHTKWQTEESKNYFSNQLRAIKG